jgi:RimJ/RimL family protein N-acetyltransferase
LALSSVIRSRRLDLIPLCPAVLRASLELDRETVGERLGLRIPEVWPDIPHVLELRLRQLEADPALEPWLLRAVGLRDEHTMVGHVGFHDRPGSASLRPWSPGGVELGYTIFREYRRRGYAAEACEAMMGWAQREHGVDRFVLSIGVDNGPSLALARKLGFRRIGSQIDELDGPEEIFERVGPG